MPCIMMMLTFTVPLAFSRRDVHSNENIGHKLDVIEGELPLRASKGQTVSVGYSGI